MNNRIKKLRHELNLTQQEFAARIGSVQNTITGYETGRRIPSGQVISLICKTFNVREEWLRDGVGEMFEPKTANSLDALLNGRELRRGEFVLISKFLELSPSEQNVILDYFVSVATQMTNDVKVIRKTEKNTENERDAAVEELKLHFDLEKNPVGESEASGFGNTDEN